MGLLLLCGWLVAMAAVGLLVRGLRRRDLLWTRDWFFIIFYIQGLIYLNVMPMLYLSNPTLDSWSGTLDEQAALLYVILEFVVWVCFQLPLMLLYRRRTHRSLLIPASQGVLSLHQSSIVLLAVVALLAATLFWYVMISAGLVRAILEYGNASLPLLYVSLSTPVYVIMRLFQNSAPFLSGVLLLILVNSKGLSVQLRRLILVTFLSVFGSWVGFYLANGSRSFMLLSVLMMVGVVMTQLKRVTVKHRHRIRNVVIVGLVISLFLLRTAYSIRYAQPGESLTSILNPLNFSFTERISGQGIDDFKYRLNGLDGMVAITPRALEEGFALGQAWTKLTYVTFGQIFDRSQVAELKLDRSVDPKMYLLFRYTDYWNAIDWPNSILFDLYGNFSVLGILFAGWFFAVFYSYSQAAISMRKSVLSLLLALYCVIGTLQFEAGFLAWLFSLLNGFPVFLAVVLLKPFDIARSESRANNQSPPSHSFSAGSVLIGRSRAGTNG